VYTGVYTSGMEFEWDETRRRLNLERHKLDLIRGRDLFDGRPVVVVPSPRHGELCFVTPGLIGGKFHTLVWTEREAAVRLISLRRARDAEARKYRARHG
jgi:uncharacterized protein